MDRSGISRVMVNTPYDALAPHYRTLSDQRQGYLAAVEAYVVEAAPAGVRRILDVGAGDGVRTRRIAAALGGVDYVLAEPSAGMVVEARRLHASAETIWPCTAESLPLDQGRFDLITCLWNVLGHVPEPAARVVSLHRMADLLSPGGRIIVDVNNRHNAAAYGRWVTAGRRILDAVRPDARRGDVAVTWRVGSDIVVGQGHLFTPAEVRGLVRAAGLHIADEFTIDYVTGARARRLTAGQLVYAIEGSKA